MYDNYITLLKKTKVWKMVMETLAITGLTIAGKSLFGRVIYDTYDLVKDTAYHPEVSARLAEIDLEADLEVIEALLKQIERNGGIRDEESPLAICLHQVDRMCHMIRDELKLISLELKEHEHKFMAKWRTPNYHIHLHKIVKHKEILDKRTEMLIKLIKLRLD